MSPFGRFCWGAFGALAVEFVRLWKLRDDKLGKPATYYLLSFGMILISGVWAYAVAKEAQLLAQISVGASAPVSISALGTSGSATALPPSSPDPPDTAVYSLGTDEAPTITLPRVFRFYLRALFK